MAKRYSWVIVVLLLVLALTVAGCGRKEAIEPPMEDLSGPVPNGDETSEESWDPALGGSVRAAAFAGKDFLTGAEVKFKPDSGRPAIISFFSPG